MELRTEKHAKLVLLCILALLSGRDRTCDKMGPGGKTGELLIGVQMTFAFCLVFDAFSTELASSLFFTSPSHPSSSSSISSSSSSASFKSFKDGEPCVYKFPLHISIFIQSLINVRSHLVPCLYSS